MTDESRFVGATHASPSHPDRRHRRSLRLREFDYTRQGAYFVTICTHDRQCLFGDIANGAMWVNDIGRVAQALWEEIPAHFPQVETDAWVVMPNHVHGVLLIAHPNAETSSAPVGATHASPLPASSSHRASGPPQRSLGAIVGSYKSAVSKRTNQLRRAPDAPVWQRNYYDHVIRNDADLNRIRQYIAENPARWHEDQENPARQAPNHGSGGRRMYPGR